MDAAGTALLIAVGAGVIAVSIGLVRPVTPRPADAPEAAAPVREAVVLPVLGRASPPAVPTAGRTVPPGIAATADVQAAPWAPGLRLHSTTRGRTWEGHRALVEDLTTKDRRSYAIGDLLPHGSLLVGVSTGAAQVFVADREIIELRDTGKLRSLDDFRTADEARPLRRAPRISKAYAAEAQQAVALLGGNDPASAQLAIDALVTAGEPVVELILPAVDSATPVEPVEYAFPSPHGPRHTPAVHGDLVVGVLEAITGQSFGDVFAADTTAEQRAEVARAWRRWWGLE